MMISLRKILLSGLGTGYLPVAPGTWGSAAVCAIFLLVAHFTDGQAVCVYGAMIALAAGASVGCVAMGRFAESAFGGKDPSRCTLDEWAGQALTLALLPVAASWPGWLATAAMAFVAFRVFDIIKPPPARRLEKLPAGWGILLDDLVAAIYTAIVCWPILTFWLLRFF